MHRPGVDAGAVEPARGSRRPAGPPAPRRPLNPYRDLPARAFWKTAVARAPSVGDTWTPRSPLRREDAIATFGSCFAQHVGAALAANGYSWLDTEPAPPGLSLKHRRAFGYGLFTCRTGNIYTTSLLRQWVAWALEEEPLPDEVWRDGARWFDPFRPRIEPDGFASADEMLASRRQAVRSFREAIERASVLVFTLGQVERWFHRTRGHEYPLCPGTAQGAFDPSLHAFESLSFETARQCLSEAMDAMRAINGELSFLLSVSPVPLVATNTDEHVLTAAIGAKSLLRTVAGDLATRLDHVDYLPAYELIMSAAFRTAFYEKNRRAVSQEGVAFVMRSFFGSLDGEPARGAGGRDVCDDEILEAFGPSEPSA